ncbi:MAG: hypothetical protein ACRD8O_13580 [Bryobacteraceae bacterium]
MRPKFLMSILLLTAGSAALLLSDDDKDKDKENEGKDSFEFAVIGDQPYIPAAINGSGQKVQVYPSPAYNNQIADVNKEKVEFTVHIGDIKAGDTLCEDNVYQQNLALFNTFKSAVIFTPGDNEWTDCHRANNGGMNPIERLTFLRTTFYPTNQSLGQKKIGLTRQSSTPGFAVYRENVIWREGAVIFCAVHMPGSNNNRNRTTGPFQDADAEYNARNAANLVWIDKAFDMAASSSIKGVFFFFQANPFERFLEPGQGYTVSGYADAIAKLRTRTNALKKPVAAAHGDTHYWRIDKPLTETYPACASTTPPCVPVAAAGARYEYFTRHEVFAQNDVHWTKVRVEPKNPTLFVLEQKIVAANIAVHP